MKKQFLHYIKEKRNQQFINKAFVTILFIYFTYELIRKAIYRLPDDALFFVTSDAFENFLCFSVAYVLYYKSFLQQRISRKVVSIMLSIILFSGLALLKMFRKEMPFDRRVFEDFTSYIGISFIIIALFYFFNNLNLFLNNSYLRMQEALAQSQRQLLRQQFNPHFLYNAFNSLYSLSLSNNPKTSESILKLSSMMRYITDNSDKRVILLKHEIRFIEDYIQIEKIRFGDDANIIFDVQEIPRDVSIEPLLLIPLVENAFKHGFYTNDKENFVRIKAEFVNNIFQFTISNRINKKAHYQNEEREGFGLNNLDKRLKLSYPKNSSLIINEEDSIFNVMLKIDFNGIV